MTVIDPFVAEVLDDPYPTWARLRAEQPVFRVPQFDVYLVLRHADVLDAIGRTTELSNNLTAFVMVDDSGRQMLVDAGGGGGIDVLATADEPFHTVHRRSLNRPFGAQQLAVLEPQFRAMVAGRLGATVHTGHVEWVNTVSSMLPIRAIALVMGLPDADSPRLKQWSDAGIELLSGFADGARMAECMGQVGEEVAYLGEHLSAAKDRVAAAGGVPASPLGVIDTLAAAVLAGEYDDADAIAIAVQLVGAGSDSTTGLTGSCALHLATDPEVQRVLRAEPARIPAFVEEVLRLEAPFRGHFRHVREPCSLGGVSFVPGDRLLLMWGAANRDPEVFADPDRIDLDRPNANRQLGFGWGIHHCIGAPLARLEARLAVEELLASTRSIALDETAGPPRWVPSLFLRRLDELHLAVEPA
jgi:cytochrome P450 family 144